MKINLYNLRNKRASSTTMRKTLRKTPLVRKADGTYSLVDATETASHIRATDRFFRTHLGISSLDNSGKGINIMLRVKSDDRLVARATTSGLEDVLLFSRGDSDLYSRPTISRDLVAHEMSHAYLRNLAELEYNTSQDSGAILEHLCDVLGVVMRRRTEGHAQKWFVGHPIFLRKYIALRNLEQPNGEGVLHKGAMHVSELKKYRSVKDAYFNGALFSRVFVLVAQQFPSSLEVRLAKLWFISALSLPLRPSFAHYAGVLRQRASTNSNLRVVVDSSLTSVGL